MSARRLLLLAACAGLGLAAWFGSSAGIQANPPAPPIVQLTNDHGIDARPSWSPDNRRIAFQSNHDSSNFHIYVMNADGSDRRQVTQGSMDDRHPVWMPDGKSILFDSDDGKVEEIWMVDLAGGRLKQITHLGAEANFPSASPDGQHILFYLFKAEVTDLWSIRLDGSDARPLTTNLATTKKNQCTFACHEAAWGPDSRTIAFTGGDGQNIWVARSDGGDAREVIRNGEINHFPWFLPDGRLGYITEHVSPIQSWTDAWAYDLQSGQTAALQSQMSPQGPFEWSKDNSQLLFHSPRSGNFEIYLINLNVPGGTDALRGTPVPVVLAPGAANSSTANTAGNAAAAADPPWPAAAAVGAAVLFLAGAVGLVLWRRVQH